MLADLLSECRVLQPTYVEGDPHESAYREGERNVALRILSWLAFGPADMERLNQMVTDEHERVQAYADRIQRGR